MHDKRHRHQRQQFVEEVHGQQVRRKRDTQRNAVSHRVEEEKDLLMLFFRHILKGVQGGKGPQRGDKPGKYHTHAVHLETDGKITCKMRQQKGAVGVVQQQIPYQNAV